MSLGMTTPNLLTISELCKRYPGEAGPVDVLRNISMQMQPGETVALTGESGSGKSTLLHLAGGLDQPDSGQVLLDGQDIATLSDHDRSAIRRAKIGIVFQQFNLIPSLNVAANIAFQARLASRHDTAWCANLADRLGLSDHLNKFPEQLSGGQQQRVAIARALAARPALVLADEPTGNLDEATGDIVLDLLKDLVHDSGASLLMVTHSERVAAQLGRRLHLSQGKLA